MHKFHEVGCANVLRAYYGRLEMAVAWLLALFNLFQLALLVLSLYLLCIVFFRERDEQEADDEQRRRSAVMDDPESSVVVDVYQNDESSDEPEDQEERTNRKPFMTSFYL